MTCGGGRRKSIQLLQAWLREDVVSAPTGVLAPCTQSMNAARRRRRTLLVDVRRERDAESLSLHDTRAKGRQDQQRARCTPVSRKTKGRGRARGKLSNTRVAAKAASVSSPGAARDVVHRVGTTRPRPTKQTSSRLPQRPLARPVDDPSMPCVTR